MLFPDLNIPDTPELNPFDDEWVKRWHAFTGDGLTGNADDEADKEMPSPSLGIDVTLPTPEAGDNYVNASLMLPRGNSLVRGTVIGRKRDSRGDPIGNANANPIMDSRVYRVEFDDGDICELTANIIAESMYASCDADGNKYILFDSFVDYKSRERPSRRTISGLFTTVVTHFADPLLDGICVFSGRMTLLSGNLSRI